MPYYAFHKSKKRSFFFQTLKPVIKIVQIALLGSCPVCTSLFQNLPNKWNISFRSPNHHCVSLCRGHPKYSILYSRVNQMRCYLKSGMSMMTNGQFFM